MGAPQELEDTHQVADGDGILWPQAKKLNEKQLFMGSDTAGWNTLPLQPPAKLS